MKNLLKVVVLSMTFALLFSFGCQEQAKTTDKAQAAEEQVQAESQVQVEAQSQAKPATEPAVAKTEEAKPEAPKEEPAKQEPNQVQAKPAETAPAVAQAPAVAPSEAVKPEPEKEPDPNSIAATVNGENIKEGEVSDKVNAYMARMSPQSKVSPEFISSYKKRMRGQILDSMVTEKLIESEIAKAGIKVSEQEIQQEIDNLAVANKMTLDDLKAKLKENGMEYDKWKEGMNFDKRIAFKKLMQPKFDADINVSEKDARTYYDNNKQRFDTPEQVRASHILVKIPNDINDPNAAKAAAKAKAEDILKQVKAGGNFEELAKKNSDCPSGQNGGDLNFFSRDRMAKPFADAAFGMKVGETSDLVESQFGYHIIKVTDRKDANTVSFEQVKKELIDDLSRDKQSEITQKYIESLKKSANIVYPAGSQEIAPRPTVRQARMAPRPTSAKPAEPNQTK